MSLNLSLQENCFSASRYNLRSEMEINMTAVLTKSFFFFFFPSVFTSSCLHTGCQRIVITNTCLCFPMKSVIASSFGAVLRWDNRKVLHIVTYRTATLLFFFFFFKLRWWRWCPLFPVTIDLWLLMCRHSWPWGSPLLQYIMLVTMWLSSWVLSM